ncbi:MAG: O-antigen ligase family protein [Patescibacteria group bacterium]
MKIFDTIRLSILFLFFLLLPSQLGTYYFFPFAFLNGIRIDYLAPSIFITDLLAIVLIVLYIRPVMRFLLQRRVIAILLIVLISAYYGLVPGIGILNTIKLLELLAIAGITIAAVRRNETRTARLFVTASLIGAMFQVTLAVLQLSEMRAIQGFFYWFGERFITVGTPDAAIGSIAGRLFLRPYGTFSHPNSLGGFYLLLYTLILTWPATKVVARQRAVALICCLMLVMLSFSTAAIITFAVINLVIFWNVIMQQTCRLCGIARVIILLVITGIFATTKGDPLSVEKRIWLIDSALEIIRQSPLLGVGLGSYVIAQNQFPIFYNSYFLQPVHNIILLFLAEVGLVGGGAIIALLVSPFMKIINNRVFQYCFGVVLITGMVDHYWLTLQQNQLLFFVVLGVLSKDSSR